MSKLTRTCTSAVMKSGILSGRTVDRSSKSAEYLRYIEQYFSRLLPVLRPLTHGNGGPIIAFQIENEFGSLKVCACVLSVCRHVHVH